MDNQNTGRRHFIKTAVAGSAMSLGLSQIVGSAFANTAPGKIVVRKEDVILFQGDSITDAGRDRNEKEHNKTKALGTGYPLFATSKLLYSHASKNIRIYNRGISGNKVYQLAERWDEDCIDLKPSVLSILIGVNDFWHTLSGRYTGTIETYRSDLKALLERTKGKLPDVKLIIGEPFAVAGVKAVDDTWFPKFTEYQNAAREIAGEFNAVFIPYQSIFDKAGKVAPGSYWTTDGVHASLAGNQLMAEAWLACIAEE